VVNDMKEQALLSSNPGVQLEVHLDPWTSNAIAATHSPIRRYRYTFIMFPLAYKNVVQYRTREKVGGRHFHVKHPKHCIKTQLCTFSCTSSPTSKY
jgi:hypothetical protein